jgi:hypothetical protein
MQGIWYFTPLVHLYLLYFLVLLIACFCSNGSPPPRGERISRSVAAEGSTRLPSGSSLGPAPRARLRAGIDLALLPVRQLAASQAAWYTGRFALRIERIRLF